MRYQNERAGESATKCWTRKKSNQHCNQSRGRNQIFVRRDRETRVKHILRKNHFNSEQTLCASRISKVTRRKFGSTCRPTERERLPPHIHKHTLCWVNVGTDKVNWKSTPCFRYHPVCPPAAKEQRSIAQSTTTSTISSRTTSLSRICH